MTTYRILVCTTAGNTLLDGDSKTYLRVSGNSFVKQKAKNLKRGNMILFHKEYVDKTLEEVEQYLMQEDERYVAAKERIFERNGNGIYAPKLRTYLWRGSSERIRNFNPNLEEKIFLEDEDFNQSDYREMNRTIYMALRRDYQRGGPEPIAYSTMMGWLRDTMAPADWTMFRALAEINPEFRKFHEDFRLSNENPDEEPDFSNNVYDAYKLFVGIRQGIMRYIARRKGHGEGGNGSTSRSSRRFSLGPEIDIVLRYVMDEIDDQRIAVAVTDARRIEYQIGVGHDTRGIKLSSGVMIDKERPRDMHIKNLSSIAAEENVILGALNTALEKYLQKRFKDEKIFEEKEQAYIMLEINKELIYLSGYNKARPASSEDQFNLFKKHYKSFGSVDEKKKEDLNIITNRIFNELVVGPSVVSDPDKRFVLPKVQKFRTGRLDRFPKEWHEYNDLRVRFDNNKIPENRIKETKKRLNTLRRTLIEDYESDPAQDNSKVSSAATNHGVKLDLMRKYGTIPNLSPYELEIELNKFLKSRNATTFTPEEEREIIVQYGFEELLDLSWI